MHKNVFFEKNNAARASARFLILCDCFNVCFFVMCDVIPESRENTWAPNRQNEKTEFKKNLSAQFPHISPKPCFLLRRSWSIQPDVGLRRNGLPRFIIHCQFWSSVRPPHDAGQCQFESWTSRRSQECTHSCRDAPDRRQPDYRQR